MIFIFPMLISKSVLIVALNDLSFALIPWKDNRRYSSAKTFISVGSFWPALTWECCSIPFTIESARLPWWFIFCSFSLISLRIVLTSEKFNDVNSFENPDKIKVAKFSDAKKDKDELIVNLPPKSVVVLELK